jgi:hypothetical protein
MAIARPHRSLALAAILAAAGHAAAGDVNVPGDAPTIQAGIDLAADGDRVLVAPGVYAERINLRGKAITVQGTGDASETIIDGGGQDVGYVVTFESAETGETVLRGFTITGGFGEAGSNGRGPGGGVLVIGAAPVIEGVVVSGNTGALGGGLTSLGGEPVLRDTTFVDNLALQGGAVYAEGGALTIRGGRFEGNIATSFGGALALLAVEAEVTDAAFTDNEALNAGFGGAVYANHAQIDLARLEFRSNGKAESNGHNSWTISTGGGGAIYTTNTNGRIEASRFDDNIAAFGTAVYIAGGGRVELVNNLLTRNGSICGCGTGVLYTNTSAPSVVNNTFANNGGFFGIYNYGSRFTVSNTIFAGQQVPIGGNYGTTTLAYSIYDNDLFRVELADGNVRGEARLDSDFAPRPGSPAIDAGDNLAVPDDIATDLLGNQRFFDDPDTSDTGNGDAPIVDIGAIEFGSIPPDRGCIPDMNDDGVVDTTDVLMFLAAWNLGEPRADVNEDGRIDTQDVLDFLNMWMAGC